MKFEISRPKTARRVPALAQAARTVGALAAVLGLILTLVAGPALAAERPAGSKASSAGASNQLIVNGRAFAVDAGAMLSIDDEPVTLEQLRVRVGDGRGMRASAQLASADSTVTSGTTGDITFENNLKGPITSIDPLSVLGQPFLISADTVLVGFDDATQLVAGQMLEVSGYVDLDSSVVASRVALVSSPNEWKLTGFVTALNLAASEATIGTVPGGQPIRFAGVAAQDCAGGLAVGNHVDVRANPVAPFAAGQVLDTVTRLRCRPIVPIGTPGASGAFEGLVQAVVDDATFTIAGYTVTHGAATAFRFGNADDIAAGVRLEVQGVFTAPLAFTAQRIAFIRPSIRFRAPVAPAAVVPGESITILGNTVLDNPQNRDENGIMAGGLGNSSHVEVRAYADSAGQLYATRVRSRGAPDATDYELQALVVTIAQPSFTALGITVDTSFSAFQDRTQTPITAAQFFAALEVGDLVAIEDASFDAANNRLFGGIVSFSDDDVAAQAKAALAEGDSGARVVGTTGRIGPADALFGNGFE